MKFILINIFLLCSFSNFAQTEVTPDDLKLLIGNWEGTITYLDYTTKKPFTMPANLVVEQGKKDNSLKLNNIYPKESKANNSEKITLTQNGTMINKKLVTSKELEENGVLAIQTEKKGKDANKAAVIRNTYLIGKETFIIRKEVQFESSDNWIVRSEYSYQKN